MSGKCCINKGEKEMGEAGGRGLDKDFTVLMVIFIVNCDIHVNVLTPVSVITCYG